MSAATLQKREQRAKLVADARKINDAALAEKRQMTAAESEVFDKHMDEVDRLMAEVDVEEGAEKRAQRLAVSEKGLEVSTRKSEPTPIMQADDKAVRRLAKFAKREKQFGVAYAKRGTPEYCDAFNSWMCRGMQSMSRDQRNTINEVRALQADADVVGGYLIPPIQFVNKIILFLKNMLFVRQLATVIPVTNGQSLGCPSLDADPADEDWTSELATGSEDSTMAFGRRDLFPHPLAKRIKVSNKLLRLASSVENLVLDRLGYKFGVSQEKAFMTGNGAQQPLGLFTASSQGISTGRDINTGSTTTAVTADSFIEAKYNLKAQYQMSPSTAWLLNRTTVKNVRKLKDGIGQYIWAAGLGGTPDTILEKPFYMSEYVPNTYTTGLYVGLIGDLKFYWIADSLNMAMQRLDELYAETNQTGFIGRMELDAMPVLEEAFSRMALA